MTGFEPMTSRAMNPGALDQTAPHRKHFYKSEFKHCTLLKLSGRRDSNPQLSAWKADALAN